MYKTRKQIFSLALNSIILVLYIVLVTTFVPKTITRQNALTITIVPVIVFILLLVFFDFIRQLFKKAAYNATFEKSETQYLVQFTNRVRFCYSLDDFYKAIADILEDKADCSVLFIDREKNYVLYNSPDRIASSTDVRFTLALNFPATQQDGVYFIDDSFNIARNRKHARGFFVAAAKLHLYVFCRYTKLFDDAAYEQLLMELKRFPSRVSMLTDFAEIADLIKEWNQLADAQRSFLPEQLIPAKKLKLAAYYKPLVNVSGDYYSVFHINEHKTLLLMGDVSGKGLSAALIMGLVVNTVKIVKNKEDLVSMIHAIDNAIKSMELQDKYTALFLGIVDTQEMILRYINASMPEPIILSRIGHVKQLASNVSVIGIIDVNDIQVAEQKLYNGDTILLTTDGVSEAKNEEGVELGETDLFKQTLRLDAEKQPQQFIDDIVHLISEYTNDTKAHDDVTIMAAKVG
ncbi:MAG: serine/threonine-protein phosphatase [Treponema sp.]|nr:serine/threonine-protein phosphatase [Treponema sp.]